MHGRRLLSTALVLALFVTTLLATRHQSHAQSGGPDMPLPNVQWQVTDSVAGCPAGDSVVAGHPSRLRVWISYNDAGDSAMADIPPDSIWVTYALHSGNLVVNDQIPSKIFADDSTDVDGNARINFPSVSGCGKLNITLYVSNVNEGTKTVTIRTTDSLIAGRTVAADTTSVCDLNYDGSHNSTDRNLATSHFQHWHRQALHGGLVRLTNYCEDCRPGTENTRGESAISWSPNGQHVAFTAFLPLTPPFCITIGDTTVCDSFACKVFIVPSDPANGTAIRQITSVPSHRHDYDPMWSPDNTFLVFDRGDSVIIKKGIVGFSADTSDVSITASSSCDGEAGHREGDLTPAISPDGGWIAFSRCNEGGGHSIWKVPIAGGTAKQLTPAAKATDFYPAWSMDGMWVYFQRDSILTSGWRILRVPTDSGAVEPVFIPPDGSNAVLVSFAPDSMIAICGYGRFDGTQRTVAATTFDPRVASLPLDYHFLVRNYEDPAYMSGTDFPILSPRISPDGTRLLLGGAQVYAARRNMNLPPHITEVIPSCSAPVAMADTSTFATVWVDRGHENTIEIVAEDPENDELTYGALFLPAGASFNSSAHTLSWTPSVYSGIGTVYYVRFLVTTASGGTDAVVVALRIVSACEYRAVRQSPAIADTLGHALGPNPMHGSFAFTTSGSKRFRATLTIYDVGGRVVSVVEGPMGTQLIWNGQTARGAPVENGVYFYRVRAHGLDRVGRVALVR